MSSSQNSASNDNSDEPKLPAKKKIRVNDVHGVAKDKAGKRNINTCLPSDLPLTATNLSASGPNMPTGVSGSELQQVEQLQPHQQPVQQVEVQVIQGKNQNNKSLTISDMKISSEGEAINDGHGPGSKNMEISFDKFPYYLSDRTKHHLVASYFIHTKHKVHTSKPDMQNARHRILLSGPEGSEIYQEALTVALARHFGVKLVVLDCGLNVNALAAFGTNASVKFHLLPALPHYLWCTKSLGGSMNMKSFPNAISQSSESQQGLPSLYEKSPSRALKIGDRVIFTGLRFDASCSQIAPRGPSFGNRGKVLTFGCMNKVGVRFDMPVPEGNDLGGLCKTPHGFFCYGNEVCIDMEDQLSSPFEGLFADKKIILFVKHAENCLVENFAAFQGINSIFNKLPHHVFLIGSHIEKKNAMNMENFHGNKEKKQKFLDLMKTFSENFPDRINIDMPEDPKLFDDLKHQLERDAEVLKVQNNRARIYQVLLQNGLECEDIEAVCLTDQKITFKDAERMVKWALGNQVMNQPQNDISSKVVLSRDSIFYALDHLRATLSDKSLKTSIRDIPIENEHEKRLLADVIHYDEIGVKFDDIGALDSIKDTLKELVMLPLQRPELFVKGQLRKPCRGILLFGPSGTGKTMLAKAVATEAGANFINISAPSIGSMWYGESEKYVKAIFSLASKIAPSVVFIDELDSLLGTRRDLDHEVTRKIKYEFMINWDGLRTKDTERVLVLAATNRPFDLDEAVIRRLPYRMMVNLPDARNRSKILKVILAKEDLSPAVDFDAIAQMTDGFSGSDLKNLCVAAAYRPMRELLKNAKHNSQQTTTDKPADIRPLVMEDFKYACEKVRASVSTDSNVMRELLQWNEVYGEGGSQNQTPLSYYI